MGLANSQTERWWTQEEPRDQGSILAGITEFYRPRPPTGTLWGPTGPGSHHLVTLAESVVNTNLYNKQYNEDLKELMIKTIKSFK